MGIQRIVALAALFAVIGPAVPASAQLFPSLVDPSASPSDSLVTAPVQPSHVGLLGKRYLEARYLHLRSDESNGFDEAFHGFDVTFNSPIPWTDQLVPGLGTDVFVNGGFLRASDSIGGISFELDAVGLEGGLTLHSVFGGPVRPFVQLGVDHTWTEIEASFMGISATADDDQTEVLVRPGIEVDLASFIAMRTMLDIETDGDFDQSIASAELIAWLSSNAYLRLGVFVPLEADSVGFAAGGGLSF